MGETEEFLTILFEGAVPLLKAEQVDSGNDPKMNKSTKSTQKLKAK